MQGMLARRRRSPLFSLTLCALLAGCNAASAPSKQTVGSSIAARAVGTRSRQSTRGSSVALGELPSFWTPGSFKASPSTVAIGHTVTFSGAGCPAGADAQVVAPVAAGPVITRPDRTWSVTAIIPEDSQVGSVPAYATCATPPNTVTAYTPISLNITTYRRLDARPSTVARPGATLILTAIGSCPYSPYNSVDVELYDTKHEPSAGATSVQLVAAPHGNWSGPFTVPTSAPPGSYLLVANCEGFRTFAAGYMPLPINVLGARQREVAITR